MNISRQRASKTGRCQVIDSRVAGKWTAVPGGFDPHDGVTDREYAQEQHRQEQSKVKVVGPRGSKDNFVWYVAGQYSPGTQIHEYHELDHVQNNETRTKENSHPNHTCGIFDVSIIDASIKVTVLNENVTSNLP